MKGILHKTSVAQLLKAFTIRGEHIQIHAMLTFRKGDEKNNYKSSNLSLLIQSQLSQCVIAIQFFNCFNALRC